MYPGIVGRRVDVRQQTGRRAESVELGRFEHGHVEPLLEAAGTAPAGGDVARQRLAGLPAVAGDQRLDPLPGADPRTVVAVGALRQRREQCRGDERQIARQHDHPIAVDRVQRRVDAADGSEAGLSVGDDPHRQVGEPGRVGRHDDDLGGHRLQRLHLSNDDGAAVDDEPALVATAVPAGPAPRHDGGGRHRHVHEGIMTDAHLGRLVAASLHQAISEELPLRLDFYEHWLHSEALRDSTFGVGPMQAVLGFLRTEGEAYERVMERAGMLAADWALETFPSMRRRMTGWLPGGMRLRAGLRTAGAICTVTDRRNTPRVRGAGRVARLELRSSVFCAVREYHPTPLCGFYRALALTTLAHFGLQPAAEVSQCRAMGDPACVITFSLGAARPAGEPAAAA